MSPAVETDVPIPVALERPELYPVASPLAPPRNNVTHPPIAPVGAPTSASANPSPLKSPALATTEPNPLAVDVPVSGELIEPDIIAAPV